MKELAKLYSSANLFINEYSTTQLEACIFNLPIINAAIGNYRNTNIIYLYTNNIIIFEFEKYESQRI